MINGRISVAAFVIASCVALSGSGVRVEAQNNQENTFFKCESGWTFETRNNTARCKRGGDKVYVALMPCPQATLPTGHKVGTALKQNYDGQRDMCVSEVPGAAIIAIVTQCPLGYLRAVQPGRDNCGRNVPLEVKAPSVSVQQP